MEDPATVFERHRARLFGVAYRMLGSVEDARDLTQEAYLRWHSADREAVRAPEAWLVAVTTRLAIDRLRRTQAERRRYVGSWLPEPVATRGAFPPDLPLDRAADLSFALLVVLERLAPAERAALVLRDALDAEYADIARILDKSEAAVRQIVHRARARATRGARRPLSPDVSPEVRRRLLARFLTALENGDHDALAELLHDDVTWTSDSGGKARAARNVLVGADRVARFALGITRKNASQWRHRVTWLNGEPALATYAGERLAFVTPVDVAGERFSAFFQVLNPDKLRFADDQARDLDAVGS